MTEKSNHTSIVFIEVIVHDLLTSSPQQTQKSSPSIITRLLPLRITAVEDSKYAKLFRQAICFIGDVLPARPINRNKILYSICIGDVMDVAESEFDITLTAEEVEKIADKMGDYFDWYEAVIAAIGETLKLSEATDD